MGDNEPRGTNDDPAARWWQHPAARLVPIGVAYWLLKEGCSRLLPRTPVLGVTLVWLALILLVVGYSDRLQKIRFQITAIVGSLALLLSMLAGGVAMHLAEPSSDNLPEQKRSADAAFPSWALSAAQLQGLRARLESADAYPIPIFHSRERESRDFAVALGGAIREAGWKVTRDTSRRRLHPGLVMCCGATCDERAEEFQEALRSLDIDFVQFIHCNDESHPFDDPATSFELYVGSNPYLPPPKTEEKPPRALDATEQVALSELLNRFPRTSAKIVHSPDPESRAFSVTIADAMKKGGWKVVRAATVPTPSPGFRVCHRSNSKEVADALTDGLGTVGRWPAWDTVDEDCLVAETDVEIQIGPRVQEYPMGGPPE